MTSLLRSYRALERKALLEAAAFLEPMSWRSCCVARRVPAEAGGAIAGGTACGRNSTGYFRSAGVLRLESTVTMLHRLWSRALTQEMLL